MARAFIEKHLSKVCFTAFYFTKHNLYSHSWLLEYSFALPYTFDHGSFSGSEEFPVSPIYIDLTSESIMF